MRLRLILACCSLLLFAGCGGKSSTVTPDPNSNEVTQFHEAVKDGDVEIVRRLIAAKPYLVNAKDAQGVSPLKEAQQAGNEELADLIRKKGGKE